MTNETQDEEQDFYWETEFFAVSVLTGDVENYNGIFITAPTIQEAIKVIRESGFSYLQVTGTYFETLQSAMVYVNNIKDEKNISKKDSMLKKFETMSFEEICRMLDNQPKEKIEELISMESKFPNFVEQFKAVKGYYKNKYGDKEKGENNNEEGKR